MRLKSDAPDGIVFDPASRRVFTADGVVTIAECSLGRCSAPRALSTVPGSRTSALDERTRGLFVPYDDRVGGHTARGRSYQGFGVLVLQL